MESIGRNRDRARIEARTRDTTAKRVHYASRPEHGAVMMVRSRFGAFIRRAFTWVRNIFRRAFRLEQSIPRRCSRNWHYDGIIRAKDCNGGRYDVAMRKRGRKYKMACA